LLHCAPGCCRYTLYLLNQKQAENILLAFSFSKSFYQCEFVTEKSFFLGYAVVTKEKQPNFKEEQIMKVLHINKDNFHQEVLNSEKPVLLDFFASWCGPCRMVGPILDEIAEEREDIKVCKVDIDEQPELASRFRIMSVPTLMVLKEGSIVDQSVGAKPKHQILAMV
jgi:thioredoxin 1